MADLHVAVEEDVGVGAAHKLKHLYSERGVGALAVLQDAQSLSVLQQGAAEEGNGQVTRMEVKDVCLDICLNLFM